MPIPYAVSRWGHASNAAHPRDAGSVSRDPALTFDATAAPPETLRRIFLRANGDERRVISLQVAWMVHVFRHDGRTPCAHACGRPSAGADAVRGDLPFDKAALKRAWTTQFPHLLDDGRAGRQGPDRMVSRASRTRWGHVALALAAAGGEGSRGSVRVRDTRHARLAGTGAWCCADSLEVAQRRVTRSASSARGFARTRGAGR